jgi:hypothetical protein
MNEQNTTISSLHTQEPWETTEWYGELALVGNDTDTTQRVTVTAGKQKDEVAQANIRRVKAAINACAGIETSALEQQPLKPWMQEAIMALSNCADTLDWLLRQVDLSADAEEEAYRALDEMRNALKIGRALYQKHPESTEPGKPEEHA